MSLQIEQSGATSEQFTASSDGVLVAKSYHENAQRFVSCYLFTCLLVYLFTCLPVYLSTCLLLYLSTCPPVYFFSSHLPIYRLPIYQSPIPPPPSCNTFVTCFADFVTSHACAVTYFSLQLKCEMYHPTTIHICKHPIPCQPYSYHSATIQLPYSYTVVTPWPLPSHPSPSPPCAGAGSIRPLHAPRRDPLIG